MRNFVPREFRPKFCQGLVLDALGGSGRVTIRARDRDATQDTSGTPCPNDDGRSELPRWLKARARCSPVHRRHQPRLRLESIDQAVAGE